MINFNKKNNKKNSGFTLVETLVALFIFSVAILSTMAALSQGLASTDYAKGKVVAGYLAEEGIEYFRNIRDTSMLYASDKNQGWSDFLSKLQSSGCEGVGCYFDNNEDVLPYPITQIVMNPCTNGCHKLLYDSSSGKYNYVAGNISTFSRKMTVIPAADNQSVKVVSEVTWTSGLNTSTFSLTENLTNWIE